MERKSKAMAALACVALLVLIGAGCARCTMVHSGQQDQPGQEQGETASVDAEEAKDSLEKLLGTKWTSQDGKSAMSIVNGAFVERSGDEEKITYWTPEKSTSDESGFSESIWVSDSLTSTQSPSTIRVDVAGDGSLVIACDSFKLAASYTIDAPESVELGIAGNVGYLASLTGIDQAKIAECLQGYVTAKCPYAKTASWDGEIYIDANNDRTSSTFTLDDPNATIVTVTIDGKTGKISAM